MSELIYHYTTAEGLIGILSNQQIYATESRFLNDRSEIIAGIELIKNVANKIQLFKQTEYGTELDLYNPIFESDYSQDEESHISLRQELKSLGENVSSILKKKQIFITSFSTEPDSLIHWMTYAKTKVGYCIAFDKNELLSSNPSIAEYNFEKVSYKKYEQEITISNAMKFYLLQYINNNSDQSSELDRFYDEMGHIPKSLQNAYNNGSILADEILLNKLSYMAASIKNSEYDFEKEIRLISIGKTASENSEVFHRSENDIIKPTKKVKINKTAIKKIFIGPSIIDANEYHEGKIISGVKSLIENNGYKIEIIKSNKTLSK